MNPRDIFLLIMMAAIWGLNFVAIKTGLNHVPPLTFSTLRFVATFFPAIFFVKKPKVPLSKIAAYGVVTFGGQFGFMFSAIHAGLSPGLASLVAQSQVFFTIGLAAFLLREVPKFYQLMGALIAAGGLTLVGLHVGGEVTLLGLALAFTASFSWACGNMLTKDFGDKLNIFDLTVWGSLFASIPLFIAALIFEGPTTMLQSMHEIHGETLLALIYIVYLSTFFGYTIWNMMLARYPAVMVAPFTLLVPPFALFGTWLLLGEPYALWKFVATLLVLGGLAVNQFGGKLYTRILSVVRDAA